MLSKCFEPDFCHFLQLRKLILKTLHLIQCYNKNFISGRLYTNIFIKKFLSQNCSLEKSSTTFWRFVDWGGTQCIKKSHSCRPVTHKSCKNAASHQHTRQVRDKVTRMAESCCFKCRLKFLQSVLAEIFNLLIPVWFRSTFTLFSCIASTFQVFSVSIHYMKSCISRSFIQMGTL